MKKATLPTTITLTLLITLLITPTLATAQTTPNLKLTNIAGTTLNLTLQDIQALPKTTVTAQLSCYGTPLQYGEWTGVKLSELINQTESDPTIVSVNLYAQDGYTVSIPLNLAIQPDVIVAYERNNTPLSEGLRLVVPPANGAIWIAMITSISTSTTPLLEPIFSSAQTNDAPIAGPITDMQQRQPQTTLSPPPKPSNTPQPTPTAVAPPANDTAPTTKPQQTESPQLPNFVSIEAFYGLALGFIIALVIVGTLIYRRNRK